MRVFFLLLSCMFCFMSIGAGCPRAFPEEAVAAKRAPMHPLPAPGAGRQSQVAVSAMHPLNAPVPAGNGVAFGRVVQSEKRVLIHGGPLPSVNALTQ